MRTLVVQTAEAVRAWFRKIQCEGLDPCGSLPTPEDIFVLMGGEESGDWLRAPERSAVLVGTQDMLLSRALMRGYASSRAMWPVEFAFVHEDAQWVFDEVQLMGAGLPTSAQLEAFRRRESRSAEARERQGRRPSRSLWISATLEPQWLATVDHPAPSGTSVLRIDPDSVPDGILVSRSRAAKRLIRSPVAPTSAKKRGISDYVKRLADALVVAHRDGRMTLVVLNRVDRAQALHAALKRRLASQLEPEPTLALVHSRFRPGDREREMAKLVGDGGVYPGGRIVVATQAVEAGVDVSAAVMFTECAPWSSMVQRFGRANRYAELDAGADVHWIDLLQQGEDHGLSEKDADSLAVPYGVAELEATKAILAGLDDVAPVNLPPPGHREPERRVIRRKDLYDLFDTDPDLTGFDVDVSPYVRDAEDTDIRVFWRDLSVPVERHLLRARRDEICAVSISAARRWISEVKKRSGGKPLLFRRDPQWRRRNSPGREAVAPGWEPFREQPWPGLLLLADVQAGGYRHGTGFTGDPKDRPEPLWPPAAPRGARAESIGSDAPASAETEGHDEDSLSQINVVVPLVEHLHHVSEEAESLCRALDEDQPARAAVLRAARWHDLGKAHYEFQETMRRGLDGREWPTDVLLAKTVGRTRHRRAYFRHELASALALLAHEGWSRETDLVAYLVAAHHGKVRMNLRALPREAGPRKGDRSRVRFARGVWEGDELPPLALEGGERWEGGSLRLSIMELGLDDVSRESWAERTHDLLARLGPFRLSWLEALLRVADWRASAKEEGGAYGDSTS